MALNNPSAFAKAINTGSISPLPAFKTGAGEAYGFGYGWFPIIDTSTIVGPTATVSPIIDRLVDFPIIIERSVNFPTTYMRTAALPTVLTYETDIPGPIIDKVAEL